MGDILMVHSITFICSKYCIIAEGGRENVPSPITMSEFRDYS
jgi:hypothetical protein